VVGLLAFAKANIACADDSADKKEIQAIQVDFQYYPFYQIFADAEPSELSELKQSFPKLFPINVPDSVWANKISGKDTIQNLLERELLKSKIAQTDVKAQVADIYKHAKFYFPEFKPMDVVAVISEVDYRYKVVPSDDLLIIAIDNYLGRDNGLYDGVYPYIRQNLDPENLKADVALSLADLFIEPMAHRTFIELMIYEGRRHYLQHLFAPEIAEYLLMGFSAEEHQFVKTSEEQIWRYFIDKEHIYSTDARLANRFIRPAPFSKFYLEIDRETPGGVGRYIGYRIVSAFMENADATLDQMLTTPAEELFTASKYKPRD